MLQNFSRARSMGNWTSRFTKHNVLKSGGGAFCFVHTETSLASSCSKDPNAFRGTPTMPPGHLATVGNLRTFTLPDFITGTPSDRELGRQMINTWRSDGIFQISATLHQSHVLDR